MPILIVFVLLVVAVLVVVLLLMHDAGSHRGHPVLISCHRTFDLVPTGVEVDSVPDVGRTPDVTKDNVLHGCPACGDDHQWGSADAVLIDPQR